jgi:tetratricopeptide (TPR) repeat protein
VNGRWHNRYVAAAALWAAALALPARGDAPIDPERELKALDERLLFVEQEYGRRDESAGARARRKFSEGEVQFLLQDWSHAAILLYDAVDEPEFRDSGEYLNAIYYLGESLWRQGDYPTARTYFKQILGIPGAPHHKEAVLRALDIAIRLSSYEGMDALVQQAQRIYGTQPAPELSYLAARAVYGRRDLAPKERTRRALEAFRAVPAPYQLQAAYYRGALLVQGGELGAATEEFEGCTRLVPQDAKQGQVRELCFLALGRIYSELGRYADAIDRYQEIPRESPRFNEALYEIAWGFVRSKRYEQALRTAALISDLSPESRLAPEATILQGQLYLRLGQYAEALETYNRVINQYAPVRDEIDAILTMHEDPVRYFNELIGRSDKAFDVTTVLPPVAVKWASTQSDVSSALKVVADLDAGRRDIVQGGDIADRVDAVLSRSDGLEAFPLLKEGYARAETVENGAVWLEGQIAAAEEKLLEDALPPGARAELARVDADRRDLEPRVRTLPRTPEEMRARQDRMKARFAEVDRQAFQLGYLIESSRAAIAGTQVWLDEHRDVSATSEARAEFLEEMRKHKEVVAEYEEELRALRQDIGKVTDATGGSEGSDGDAAVRGAYRAAAARTFTALAAGRDVLTGSARERLGRLEAARARLPEILVRADKVKLALRGGARAGAAGLRARVQSQRRLLKEYSGDLGGVQEETKSLIGRIAFKSFRDVRAQFYRLVLKADVGIIDVAWQRKRERLDRIQQLAAQKAADGAAMEQEYRSVLREVP